jgi:hypothetical protein
MLRGSRARVEWVALRSRARLNMVTVGWDKLSLSFGILILLLLVNSLRCFDLSDLDVILSI